MKPKLLFCTIAASLVFLFMTVAPEVFSQQDDEQEPKPKVESFIMTPETHTVIKKGLDYIASQQGKTGLWMEGNYPIVMSSLAGLALCTADHPGKGVYKEHIKKLIKRLIKLQNRAGYITQPGEDRPAYGQAFSILFLTQVYGMMDKETNKKIKKVLKKGVQFIVNHQSSSGCWYQDYRGGHNQIVTISQVQALRAAWCCGIHVPKETIKKGLRYISGFMHGGQSPGRLASSIATVLAAGDYDNPKLQPAIQTLRGVTSYNLRAIHFPIFVHLYTSQVMYFDGGRGWEDYYRRIRDWWLANQRPDGHWDPYPNVHALKPGPIYTTSAACLILQMPMERLPFFQTVKSDLNLRRMGK